MATKRDRARGLGSRSFLCIFPYRIIESRGEEVSKVSLNPKFHFDGDKTRYKDRYL